MTLTIDKLAEFVELVHGAQLTDGQALARILLKCRLECLLQCQHNFCHL